ncbi:MAG TPA: protein kinase [Thermoanaerobaculia bacterium]|nr:protein kinase [Thermoanaerobaculia bacterium]
MLAAGSRLGPYEILSPLGAGGMGEVYRARDPRLGRDVAVKVLPAAVGADPERLRRFEQEARAASALNHPNVLTVFDTGAQDGTAYLVTEVLDGETLRDRLAGGALPVRRAVEITLQVARGLAAAHDRGIVHRDLKPENLFLTRDGRVKILDFGLAKLQGGHGSASELAAAATALPGTEPGVVMGTVGYMAPEQVRGRSADHRADVFALGAILYELLTGRRAFQAESAVETMSAILKEEPPELERLHEELAPGLARIVRHCLEKAPEQRFQSAGDLAFDLEALASGEAALPSRSGVPRLRRARRRAPALAVAATAALLLAAGGTWWALRQRGAAAEVSSTRLAVLPFTIRGGPGLAYLREGLVDLLSSKLDGAGELRTVDPHALLRAAAEESGGDFDAASGAALARRFGAGLHVVGSLVAVGDRLQLAATLYQGERALGTAEASGRGEGELFRLIDDLARQLVARRFAAPAGRIARQGALTTESLPALKAYLDGERLLRSGQMALAAEAFRRAVSADPEFALGHYRLAVAAGWGDSFDEARRSAERAAALAADLPERDSRLLAALHAYGRGAADEAERLYREFLGHYPDEVEGWHGLGEVLFHHNPMRGRARAESDHAFARALALDPSFPPSLIHLMEEMALQRRSAELDALTARYLALYPASEWAVLIRFWRASLLGPEADRERAAADALADGPQKLNQALRHLLELRQLGRAEQLVERARAAAVVQPPEYHGMKMLVALGRGRRAAARPHLAAIERLRKHPSSWPLRHPFLPVPREELRAVRERWSAWEPPAEWTGERLHTRQAALIKTFVLGIADARLGEWSGVRRAAAALGRFDAPEDAALARALAATLRAHLAAGEGQGEEALRELEGIDLGSAWPETGSAYANLLFARQLRADLLFALGRWEESIAWYRSLAETSTDNGVVQAAWTHLRRAEAFERLGKPRDAAWHYAHFLALWRDPDPELRPIVRRARERLRRLNERT